MVEYFLVNFDNAADKIIRVFSVLNLSDTFISNPNNKELFFK